MLHPLAQQFDAVADAYDRGRPGYPADGRAIIAPTFRLRTLSLGEVVMGNVSDRIRRRRPQFGGAVLLLLTLLGSARPGP